MKDNESTHTHTQKTTICSAAESGCDVFYIFFFLALSS